ncbi:MAG: AMP-binding protein, partial [Deltaproteobacteria bacterium]|nr:AMP-binding protein [Deltaproteobacteria bacterium]
MTDTRFPVPAGFSRPGTLDDAAYQRMYAESVKDPEAFWGAQAGRLDWFAKWNKVLEHDFANASHQWFLGGKLNVSHNCLDRHLASRGDQTALIWEGDDPAKSEKISYRQLHQQVCRFANVLKKLGVAKGDRITIYMPMIPELPVAMLAAARIGAVHSVVFGGFSPEALADRIHDCDTGLVITA